MIYQVVRRDSVAELEEAVNAFLNQGWELVGGVCIVLAYSTYTDRNDDICSSEVSVCAQAIRRASESEGESR